MAFARRGFTLVAPVAALMIVISMAIPAARGQELEADAPHPAHIHSGTCDNLGDSVAPLGDDPGCGVGLRAVLRTSSDGDEAHPVQAIVV